ncbi:hypothetical protein CSQ96_06605 [Janthinobacterium sp. BJB412]|nr:hypothetical protein CSQ96_06605 [Janthinobacterium sp. BJB412]
MNRKRFLHLPSAAVRHFTVVEGMPADIQLNIGDYLEITPITGLEQIQWMQSFLATLELTPGEMAALKVIVAEPYSSSMNAAFTQALGEHGGGWRQLRTARVHEIIRQWAEANQVPLLKLYTPNSRENDRRVHSPETLPTAALGARQKAQQLLEVLSDDDVARLVIPTILNAILSTTQR